MSSGEWAVLAVFGVLVATMMVGMFVAAPGEFLMSFGVVGLLCGLFNEGVPQSVVTVILVCSVLMLQAGCVVSSRTGPS